MYRSERALLRVSSRVRQEELRLEVTAELALQSGPQVGEGRALRVLRSRLLRLLFFDHDQSVAPFM
jgi:hypothetical protein